MLPQLRTADVIQHVDQDLYGAYGVLEEPESGLAPATLDQLPEASAFTGIRNLLYAFEWWVFGAFAAFIWWRWVARRHRRTQAAPGRRGGAGGRPGTVGVVSSSDGIQGALKRYRFMATVVGVLLSCWS